MYTEDPRREGVPVVLEGVVARAAECLPVPIEAKLRPLTEPLPPLWSLLREFRDSDRLKLPPPPPPVYRQIKAKGCKKTEAKVQKIKWKFMYSEKTIKIWRKS